MKKINIFEHSEAFLTQLSKGAFLNTATAGKQNTMTIGWGSLGFMWGKQVCTVMVRESRYTKELLEETPVFTISVPVNAGFAEALGICGSKSGRDLDKFSAAALTTTPAQEVNAPIIKGCGLHIECRVLEKRTMQAEGFDKELGSKWYATNDWHVCYTGEIVAAYIEE